LNWEAIVIFERCSGSDASGEVPRAYARFLLRIAELSLEERCSFFDDLLAVEEDSCRCSPITAVIAVQPGRGSGFASSLAVTRAGADPASLPAWP
jgi:hypothetical protein